ncbi:MAG TPA: TolC family protein [Phycisphaerae bacterium]|nr:TolC family protein [Phycisphaerae bacterium]
MPPKPLPAALVLLAALAGCDVPPVATSLPARRPLGAQFDTDRPRGAPRVRAAALEDPNGPLSLRTALGLALARSPSLAGFSWSIRQAEAEQLQAAVLPNPELEAEFENFAGSGEFRGTRALETTIALSQLVELGGKREKRLDLARQDSKLAGWDYEARRLEVLTDVTKQFVGVLARQEKLALAREDLKLAEATYLAVEKRIAAGKAAATEQSKASIERASGRIRVRRIERELTAARHKLAATWGSREPTFDRVAGSLEGVSPLPPVGRLAPKLSQNPNVARWATEIRQRLAALSLQRAQAVPDVTVGVGVRHARETEDNDRALLVTVGVPLPVFDRNRGAIAKARFGLLKARSSQRAAEVQARADLQDAYETLASAREEALSLRDEVLPAAQRSYQAAGESFRHGKSGYLDLLDAQRTLIKARQGHVEALAAYHRAVAEIEGLIGESLESADKPQPKAKETSDEK